MGSQKPLHSQRGLVDNLQRNQRQGLSLAIGRESCLSSGPKDNSEGSEELATGTVASEILNDQEDVHVGKTIEFRKFVFLNGNQLMPQTPLGASLQDTACLGGRSSDHKVYPDRMNWRPRQLNNEDVNLDELNSKTERPIVTSLFCASLNGGDYSTSGSDPRRATESDSNEYRHNIKEDLDDRTVDALIDNVAFRSAPASWSDTFSSSTGGKEGTAVEHQISGEYVLLNPRRLQSKEGGCDLARIPIATATSSGVQETASVDEHDGLVKKDEKRDPNSSQQGHNITAIQDVDIAFADSLMSASVGGQDMLVTRMVPLAAIDCRSHDFQGKATPNSSLSLSRSDSSSLDSLASRVSMAHLQRRSTRRG